MENAQQKAKEKEKEQRLKELRHELEQEIEDKVPNEELESAKTKVDVQQLNESVVQDEVMAKKVIEAVLFTSSKPLSISELKKVLKELKPAKIEGLINELKAEYVREGRSFGINQIAGAYEISTDPQYAPWIMKVELQKKARATTQAALETLAILAYKQPATRVEIEELRGVDVSGVLSTLMERGLVKIVGKKDVPGRPLLYGTTEKFLEHFGLKSLEDLPKIGEIKQLIEKAVNREDLIGRENLVDNPDASGENPESEKAESTESVGENAAARDVNTESPGDESVSVQGENTEQQ